MLKKHLSSAFLGCAMAAFATGANAYQINFESAYNANWADISPSFGSIAGEVAVSYADPQRNLSTLRYWQGGYSGGHSAAFAGTGEGSTGVIYLTPLSGNSVTLNSFFLGSYLDANRASSYYIDNLSTPGIDQTSGSITIGATGLTVTPNISSTQGIVIHFGPTAYNVGINHINFSVTPVPEPDAYALLLAGLGLIATIARRRRAS